MIIYGVNMVQNFLYKSFPCFDVLIEDKNNILTDRNTRNMFKLMGKEIITILRSKFGLIGPMNEYENNKIVNKT